MKKKIANIIELILVVITFIVLITSTVVAYPTQAQDIQNLAPNEVYTSVGVITMMSEGLLIYPMYFFYVVIAIMCIISIFTNSKHREGVMHSIVAVLWFISINVNIGLLGGHVAWKLHSFEGFPVKMFEILALGVLVIGFAKRSSLIVGVAEQKVVNVELSKADELAKFKDLLDKGAITQEEFEVKKKQLLGL